MFGKAVHRCHFTQGGYRQHRGGSITSLQGDKIQYVVLFYPTGLNKTSHQGYCAGHITINDATKKYENDQTKIHWFFSSNGVNRQKSKVKETYINELIKQPNNQCNSSSFDPQLFKLTDIARSAIISFNLIIHPEDAHSSNKRKLNDIDNNNPPKKRKLNNNNSKESNSSTNKELIENEDIIEDNDHNQKHQNNKNNTNKIKRPPPRRRSPSKRILANKNNNEANNNNEQEPTLTNASSISSSASNTPNNELINMVNVNTKKSLSKKQQIKTTPLCR